MNRTSLLLFALALLFVENAIAQSTTFYVSPTGNDSILDSANSASNPFETPNRAQKAITDLGACSSRTQPVVVEFETGLYPLGGITGTYAGAWTLASGTGCSASPVTYTNYSGGNPVISGGVKLAMTQIGTSSYYKAALPSTLTTYSPEALYYNNTRRFRARPGSVSGSGLSGLEGAYYRVTQLDVCGSGGTSECYDRFQYTAGDPPDSVATWSNYKGWNPGGQPSSSPCYSTTTQPADDGDIEILVFEYWTMSRERIACVDTTNKIVYLEASTQTDTNHGYITGHRYVIENDNTGTASSPGLLQGQFFIDRTATPFELYYRAQTGETPNTANVVIPVLAPGTTTGAVVAATDLQYVTFSNLTFAHDGYIPTNAGFGAIQSNTNLPAMVTCLDCSNTTWTGNTFTQTIGNALWMETDSSTTLTPTTNYITYNYFYDLGSDGLVYGNLPAAKDTANNILQAGKIEENLFQGYGRMYAGASGLEHPSGSGTTIENNDITDGYNSGIGVCVPNGNINCGGTGTGNGGTNYAISDNITGNLNHVWNIGKGVTDDMGAFYIATYAATGNTIENNRLHDVQDAQPYDTDGYGGNGIYIDSTTGNISVENNLVYRVTEHTVQNTQGPPGCGDSNTIHNNILAYGRVAMFMEAGGSVQTCLTETISNNIFYFDRVYNSACGIGLNTAQCDFYVQAGCTVLYSSPTTAQIWNPNLYWDTSTAFGGTSYSHAFYTDYSNCTKYANYTFTGWQGLGQEAGGAVFSPGFVNPTCTDSTAVLCEADSTQDNYAITGVGVGQTLTITTGNYFTAFSMTAPGRQSPTFTPSAIQDTFPTLMFSTVTSSGNF
jgi:hypothetical protein